MTALLDQCPDCSGFGYHEEVDRFVPNGASPYYQVPCETCDGSREAPVLCPCCDHEVDEHGYCRGCEEFAVVLPLTDVRHVGPGSIAA